MTPTQKAKQKKSEPFEPTPEEKEQAFQNLGRLLAHVQVQDEMLAELEAAMAAAAAKDQP